MISIRSPLNHSKGPKIKEKWWYNTQSEQVNNIRQAQRSASETLPLRIWNCVEDGTKQRRICQVTETCPLESRSYWLWWYLDSSSTFSEVDVCGFELHVLRNVKKSILFCNCRLYDSTDYWWMFPGLESAHERRLCDHLILPTGRWLLD